MEGGKDDERGGRCVRGRQEQEMKGWALTDNEQEDGSDFL